MTERVVIVTGSRDWADEHPIHAALKEANPTLVVEGGARGGDSDYDQSDEPDDAPGQPIGREPDDSDLPF